MPGPTATTTPPSCDRCRTRKVKCVPLVGEELAAARLRPGERCKGCYRADKECTHNYVHKKPGRPLGSRKRSTTAEEAPKTSSVNVASDFDALSANSALYSSTRDNHSQNHNHNHNHSTAALYPTYHTIEPELHLGVSNGLERVYEQARTSTSIATYGAMASTAAELFPNVLQQQAHQPFDTVSPGHGEPWEHFQSLDEIVEWSDVCWFVSLFLRDHHCLVPLVHKPTFSQDVLNRRDRRDESFRGLLCSIVAYAICQSPISIMIDTYTRPQLVSLLHKCTRAAEIIRQRQRGNASLVLLASTVLDWIAAQGVGKPHLCDALIAETTRLSHALGLSAEKPRAATDTVQLELCRRLYWIIYSKDKVDALSGRPITLPDFEAPGPLPLEIDDDYITAAGCLPQPRGKTSYMGGFVFIMRLWMIVSSCVARHRAFANGEAGDSKEVNLAWLAAAQNQLRDLLDGLPISLRTELSHESEEPSANPSLFGIQQTNTTITVLCAEFALLDFRASLAPDLDTRFEREDMARRAYRTLEHRPIEYVASNGESMRGKVLRIILTLLNMTTEPDNFSQNVWDWWNMYSRVQSLQVVPDETMLLLNQAAA